MWGRLLTFLMTSGFGVGLLKLFAQSLLLMMGALLKIMALFGGAFCGLEIFVISLHSLLMLVESCWLLLESLCG